MRAYCSWCFRKTYHDLKETCQFSRDVYQCRECSNLTVECRYCKNMARGKQQVLNEQEVIAQQQAIEEGGWVKRKVTGLQKNMAKNWTNELCAEHDGTIASFDNLAVQINDLSEYKTLFKREKWNLQRGGMIVGGVVGGIVVFGPLYYVMGPAVASVVGSSGFLGTTAGGTVISSLSGAALTNASLAAIGGGSLAVGGMGMAGGAIFITAAGAALGSHAGGMISNSYFGQINGFDIKKLRSGSGPALVFVNGFLSQKTQTADDWINVTKKRFPNNPCYLVTWEAKTLYDLGSVLLTGGGAAVKAAVEKLAKRCGPKTVFKALSPVTWPYLVKDLLANPWHCAMAKAGMTGILLADLLARTRNEDGFILMGHSLGSRVIHYALTALSTRDTRCIKEVYLLGGAVDRCDVGAWQAATKSVQDRITNIHSENDLVLKYLYQGANLKLSDPIGLGAITCKHEKIVNRDVARSITGAGGHMDYKKIIEI